MQNINFADQYNIAIFSIIITKWLCFTKKKHPAWSQLHPKQNMALCMPPRLAEKLFA